MTLVKACACGSTQFFVNESYSLRGYIADDEPGVLHTKTDGDGGVDEVICALCGQAAPAALEIEFN